MRCVETSSSIHLLSLSLPSHPVPLHILPLHPAICPFLLIQTGLESAVETLTATIN